MNSIIIEDIEHEIPEEVAEYIHLLARDRSRLQNLLKATTNGGAEVPCNGGLADTKAEMGRLRYALKRLGSMEAFTMSRSVNKETDAELLARIDYARRVLAG